MAIPARRHDGARRHRTALRVPACGNPRQRLPPRHDQRAGEIERLFWPNVDHGQHLGELRLGLERDGETHWLDEAPCSWAQSYDEGIGAPHDSGSPCDDRRGDRPRDARRARARSGIRSSSRAAGRARRTEPRRRRPAGPGTSIRAQRARLLPARRRARRRARRGGHDVDDAGVERARARPRRRRLLRSGRRTSSRGVVEEARVLVAFGLTPDEAIAAPAAAGIGRAGRPRAERTAHDREAIALVRAGGGRTPSASSTRALSSSSSS